MKKAFKDLTTKGQKARLAKYEAMDKKYGVKEGLFRVTRMSRHADKEFVHDGAKQVAASFGFNVVPVKGVDEKDFADGKFVWVNQLINKESGAKVIDAMEQLQADLKNTKSVLVSLKYKKNAAGYINVNSLYRRDNNVAAKTTTAAAANDEKLPY